MSVLSAVIFHCKRPEDSDLIEFILLKGANVNSVDSAGRTPLHIAAMSCNQGAASLLLKAQGVKKNGLTYGLETPLHLAIK